MNSNTPSGQARQRWTAVRGRLALAIGVTAFSLWCVEVVLTLVASKSYESRVSDLVERSGRVPDRRARLDAVRDMRRTDSTAVPLIWAVAYLDIARRADGAARELLPLSSRSRSLTVYCNEGDGWRSFISDRHGFANPDGAWDDSVNVMLVGDSYALGQCVRTPETPMALLRGAGYKGITTGNPSNGPLSAFATFREYVEPVRPRHVLWLFFQNDVDELEIELREPLLQRYGDKTFRQGLMDRTTARDSALDDVLEKLVDGSVARYVPPSLATRLKSVVTLYTLRQLASGVLHRAPPLSGASKEVLAQALETARDRTRSWGGDLSIVYLPSWEQFRGSAPVGDTLRAFLTSEARRLGLPLLDATEAIAGNDVWAAFPLGDAITAHYSAVGNARLAAALGELIESRDRERAAGPTAAPTPR